MDRMKRELAAALLCLPLLGLTAKAAPNESGTSARAAAVIEMKTGRVLFEYNGADRLPQASTTKIMTALLALEETDLDGYFTVDSDAIHVEGSSMGLQEGDQVSLRQLCYGMLLPSGNDAANATAVRLAGSLPAFAGLMNERARQLGLSSTAFVTPSGLDAPGHYTTALELAQLARYAMGDETFREICCQYTAKTHFGNPPYDRYLTNYNKLLDFYEPCIGIKTGFTGDAGRVLVSAAAKDGVELICVTMNDPDDWADHERLYEQYFAELSPTDLSPLIGSIAMPVAGGDREAQARPVGDLLIPLRAGEYERLSCRYSVPPFEYAPVSEGGYAGQVEVLLDGKPLCSFPFGYTCGSEPLIPYREQEGPFKKLQKLWEKITA